MYPLLVTPEFTLNGKGRQRVECDFALIAAISLSLSLSPTSTVKIEIPALLVDHDNEGELHECPTCGEEWVRAHECGVPSANSSADPKPEREPKQP